MKHMKKTGVSTTDITPHLLSMEDVMSLLSDYLCGTDEAEVRRCNSLLQDLASKLLRTCFYVPAK